MVPRVLTLVMCFVLQAMARSRTAQAPFRTTQDDSGCPGIFIVGVRGTLEQPGFGAMQPLVDKLLADIPSSESVAIDYPAAGIEIEDGKPVYLLAEYIRSVEAGREKLSDDLISLNEDCPRTSVVLMGYSQGAQVSGDVLCGSSFRLFPEWDALEDKYKNSIKAFITLGDPRNNIDNPIHIGNSTKAGIFKRVNFEDCGSKTISSWRTYCDATDVFCDHGDSVEAHLHYVDTYFNDIISFIKGKLEKSSRSAFGGYGEKVHCGL